MLPNREVKDYKALLESVNELLAPHKITTKTDVLEETLLIEAGVETKPTKCRFGYLEDNGMHIAIRGLSESDTKLFLDLIKKMDPDARTQYVRIPNDPLHISDAQYFVFKCDKAYDQLLATFKQRFNHRLKEDPENIDRYKRESEPKPPTKGNGDGFFLCWVPAPKRDRNGNINLEKEPEQPDENHPTKVKRKR